MRSDDFNFDLDPGPRLAEGQLCDAYRHEMPCPELATHVYPDGLALCHHHWRKTEDLLDRIDAELAAIAEERGL